MKQEIEFWSESSYSKMSSKDYIRPIPGEWEGSERKAQVNIHRMRLWPVRSEHRGKIGTGNESKIERTLQVMV